MSEKITGSHLENREKRKSTHELIILHLYLSYSDGYDKGHIYSRISQRMRSLNASCLFTITLKLLDDKLSSHHCTIPMIVESSFFFSLSGLFAICRILRHNIAKSPDNGCHFIDAHFVRDSLAVGGATGMSPPPEFRQPAVVNPGRCLFPSIRKKNRNLDSGRGNSFSSLYAIPRVSWQ